MAEPRAEMEAGLPSSSDTPHTARRKRETGRRPVRQVRRGTPCVFLEEKCLSEETFLVRKPGSLGHVPQLCHFLIV